MKRPWITLLIIAMAVAVALPARAGAPDFCSQDSPHYKPEGHPNCPTVPTDPPAVAACASVKFIEGDRGSFGYECDWTPAKPVVVNGSTSGVVTVNVVEGDIANLTIFVRDSAPGDVCELTTINKTIGKEFTASFPLFYDYPADRDYDEDGIYRWDYGGESYWSWSAAHWCVPLDPVEGQWEDPNAALRVNVNYRAKEHTKVSISFTPGQDVSP